MKKKNSENNHKGDKYTKTEKQLKLASRMVTYFSRQVAFHFSKIKPDGPPDLKGLVRKMTFLYSTQN